MLTSLDHHELLVFWAQLLVLYAAARLLGQLARSMSMPSVVGELGAGLLLGPSVFGVIWPSGFEWFLPDSEVQSALLLAIAWFGAAFLLVVAGFETDLDLIRRLGRAAALVTGGSLLVPLIGGLVVGASMPTSLYGESATRLVFTLFIATSIAVSALAVVAKILGDLGLMRRDVGQITIAVGMANDLIGWVILGVIAALAASGVVSLFEVTTTAVGLAGFLVVALTAGQWVIDRSLRLARRDGQNLRGALTVMVAAMLGFGVITQWLGVEAVLGTFVAGIVLARSPYQQIEGEHVIEDLTTVLFAPLFFATAGLRLDLSLLQGDALVWAIVLLLAAVGLKFVGSFLGARLARLTVREGLVLGAGLNARGALEIIIATVGLSLGVLNSTSFTIVVMIPLVTTLVASIGLRLASKDLEGSVAERERLAMEEALDRNVLVRDHRILLPSIVEANSVVAAEIVHFAWPESLRRHRRCGQDERRCASWARAAAERLVRAEGRGADHHPRRCRRDDHRRIEAGVWGPGRWHGGRPWSGCLLLARRRRVARPGRHAGRDRAQGPQLERADARRVRPRPGPRHRKRIVTSSGGARRQLRVAARHPARLEPCDLPTLR